MLLFDERAPCKAAAQNLLADIRVDALAGWAACFLSHPLFRNRSLRCQHRPSIGQFSAGLQKIRDVYMVHNVETGKSRAGGKADPLRCLARETDDTGPGWGCRQSSTRLGSSPAS